MASEASSAENEGGLRDGFDRLGLPLLVVLLVLLLPARVRDARGWLHLSLPKGLSSPSVSWNVVGLKLPSAASRRKRR